MSFAIRWLTITLFLAMPLAARAASFTPIGTANGPTIAMGVSPDGSKVVGYLVGAFNFPGNAFVWDSVGGLRALDPLPGGTASAVAWAATDDGSAVVGWSDSAIGRQAFILDDGDAIRGLGIEAGYEYSVARAVSADGSVIVGSQGTFSSLTTQAVVWDGPQGMRLLGDLPAGASFNWSEATDVSANGEIVVGSGTSDQQQSIRLEHEAFIWDAVNGMRGLGGLPGQAPISEAKAISGDGSTVVGHARVFNAGDRFTREQAFVWDAVNGMRGIGFFGRFEDSTIATDVSADGSMVVGYAPPGEGASFAFVWDQANGLRPLDVLLRSLGVDMTGWRLERAAGISADGKTIVGTGLNPSGKRQAWIAVIPEPGTALLMGLGLMALAWIDPRR